ncbi:hypothetical protein [Methylobacterium adhaesivum]|uniref:Uncharacterized protein n=1 Tax=Methylobacterium adhaesivum TaxID=333297 RepID=A0ABT8BLI1_9HYPH|nr:hypothetical protein [Methylobacterium adhaesivum]MDN3593057.1 hypothetical protein [Methylobacterium adhaesivum]
MRVISTAAKKMLPRSSRLWSVIVLCRQWCRPDRPRGSEAPLSMVPWAGMPVASSSTP